MTGKVALSSALIRKKWLQEGLLQQAKNSFWNSYIGNSKSSIIYQAKGLSATDGHTVIFDYSGNLHNKAIKGRNTAYGKGETKKKFSELLTVERYRLVADNGDIFDGIEIGDLSINQHSKSRQMLAELFMRFKDQAIFDTIQGTLGQKPTHIIDLGATFSYNDLLDIEKKLKSSIGFSTGGIRRPLNPYMTKDGEPCWMFVMDSTMASFLKKDSNYQKIVYSGDIRGNQNRLFSGIFGKIGSLYLVEAPNFFGSSDKGVLGLESTGIEIAGLRQYSKEATATEPIVVTGQPDFSTLTAGKLHSRGLLLGTGAVQLAMGKQPDYKIQHSMDYSITSESMVEFWMAVRKCNMMAENVKDYEQAKVAGIDYGVIAVDLQVN